MTEETSSLPQPWVPTTCTLPTVEQPVRLAEFDEFFATALRGVRDLEGSRVRLELEPNPAVAARAADLAARETGCCSFFTFTLTAADGQLLLEVATPPDQAGVLAALAARAAAAMPA